MPSKLSRFCEGLIEASWLAAIVLIPVFFNNYTSRIFEPDKAALLRSLALVAAAAWVVKLVDRGVHWDALRGGAEQPRTLGGHLRNLLRVPLAVPALGIAFSYLVSTLLSVVPNDSWGGSYYRLQGMYTWLAYLVLFAALIGNLRQRSQLNRLVSAAILASIPIILYALLQRYELEPLVITRRENEWQRVTSNLGAPVFLAAYLILIFQLTVMRLIQSISAAVHRQGSRLLNGLLAGGYFLLAGSQLFTVLLTGSRGAFLGLILGLLAFFLLLSLYWRKRWPVIVVSALGVALFAFLFLLGLPNGPFQGLMESQTLGNTFTRFARIFDETGDSARFRIVTWQIADNVFSNTQPFEYLDGRSDGLGAFRQVIGYGPETQWAASARFYVMELTRTAGKYLLTDRYHNELWDVLVTTGGLGLVLQIAFYAFLIYLPLRWLGVVPTRRMQILFWSLFFGLGVAGAAFLIWRQGANFGWMGFMFGVVLGVLGYLFLVALFARYEKLPLNLPMPYAILTMAGLAGVLAHWIEFSVSFTIVSTGMLVFIFAALVVLGGYILPRVQSAAQDNTVEESLAAAQQPQVVSGKAVAPSAVGGRGKRRGESAQAARRAPRSSGAWAAFWTEERFGMLLNALLVVLIVATLGYIFLQISTSTSIFRIIGDSLTRVHGASTSTWPALLLMVLVSWLGGCLILSWEDHKDAKPGAWLKPFGWMVLASGLVSLVFWLVQAGLLSSLLQMVQTSDEVMGRVTSFEGFLGVYYVFILLMLAAMAWTLVQPWPRRTALPRQSGFITASLMAVAAALMVIFTNLRVIQADSAVAALSPFLQQGQYTAALQPYEHAVEMAPTMDNYYLLTGKVYLGAATTATDSAQFNALISKSESWLKKGLALNPVNGEYLASLGTLYSNWASRVSDADRKAALVQLADQSFSRATQFNPQDSDLWNKWAYLQLGLLGQPEKAFESVQRALWIYPNSDMSYALLGDYYNDKGQALQGDERTQTYALAAENYLQAVTLNPDRLAYWLALGNAYSETGQYQQAIDAFNRGRNAFSASDTWQIDRVLAGLYARLGQKQAALDAIQSALNSAPDSAKPELEQLQTTINSMP